jgi:exodeoxyribonuclease VIII
MPWRTHLFLVVQNTAPHEFGLYELDADALALGYTQTRDLMATWDRCMETGIWPGLSPTVKTISLPPYAFKE